MASKKEAKTEAVEEIAEIVETVEEVETPVVDIADTTEEKAEAKQATAKAGKRSDKALKEAEALEAKEERKAQVAEQDDAPKPKQKPRVRRFTKNQKASRELLDTTKLYTIEEAVALVPKVSKVKFDATVELHVALSIDPRQADQQFRNSVVLPAGSGKAVRIAVLADDKLSKLAADAGAELTDSEQIMADIAAGKFNFDMLVTTPDKMATLGRHAKVLGPKGLMPSPKSGTVTADPAKAVGEIKKGRLDLKNDANGIIHVSCGKVSFKEADLLTNAKAVLATVVGNRPSGVKGIYIKSIYLAATMSPSIKIDPASVSGDSKK